MAGWLGAFRVWFQGQPLAVKRTAIRERLDAYLNDPMIQDFRDACPPAVRTAFDDFRAVVLNEDWTVRQ